MTEIAPVEKQTTVPATPERAFALWTEGMARWWPGEKHSVSAGQGKVPKEVVFEPREGGAIYEITPEGERIEWGIVEVWEPGARFVSTWHPGHAADTATRLEVRFAAVDAGCHITLTHSGWEALGEAGSGMRDGYDGGWNSVLGRFEAAVD